MQILLVVLASTLFCSTAQALRIYNLHREHTTVWLATTVGLIAWDLQTQTARRDVHISDGSDVYGVFADNGIISVITSKTLAGVDAQSPEKHLSLHHLEQGQWQQRAMGALVTTYLDLPFRASNGDLWLRGASGFAHWNGDAWRVWDYAQIIQADPTGPPLRLLEDSRNSIWIADRRGNIARFDGDTWKHWTEADGLKYYNIHGGVVSIVSEFVEDARGHIWLRGPSSLNRFDGANWQSLAESIAPSGEPSFLIITDIKADQTGSIWLAADWSGVDIAQFDGEQWTNHQLPEDVHPRKIFIDSQERIWGLGNQAIALYAGGNWQVFPYEQARHAFADPDGAIWIAGLKSIGRYQNGGWTTWSNEVLDALGEIREIHFLTSDSVFVHNSEILALYDGQSWQLMPTPAASADFNRDGAIDMDDFFSFAERYGARREDSPYSYLYDLDGDHSIDLEDFFIFADQFGQ